MEINSKMNANRHVCMRAGVAAVLAYVVFWGIVTFLAIIISEDASSPVWLIAGVSFLGVCAGLAGSMIGRILRAEMPGASYVMIGTVVCFVAGSLLTLTDGAGWLLGLLDAEGIIGDVRFLIFIACSFPLAIGIAFVLKGVVWVMKRI